MANERARIWSAITLKLMLSPSGSYVLPDSFSTSRIIGKKRSVSKFVLAPWKIAAKRSKPAPVSIFLLGNSLYSERGTAGSALNCESTIFQISM